MMKRSLLALALSAGLMGCETNNATETTDARTMRNSDAAGAYVNPNNRPNLERTYNMSAAGDAENANGTNNIVGTVPGVGTSNPNAAPVDTAVHDNVSITGTGQAIGNGGGNTSSQGRIGSGNSTGNRGSEVGRGVGGAGSTGGTGTGSGAGGAGGGGGGGGR